MGRVEIDWPLLPAKIWCFFSAASQACYYAFLPVVYANMGLNAAQIGVLTGFSPLIGALSMPAWTALADAWHAHREILCATALVSTILHCFLPACPPKLSILLPLVLVTEGTFSPAVPLADAAIGLTLSRAKRPFADYGKQRLWGAVSWGFVFAPGIGFIEDFTTGRLRLAAPYVGHVLCNVFAVAAAVRLKQPGDEDEGSGGEEDTVELLDGAPNGACHDSESRAGDTRMGVLQVAARLWRSLRATPGALVHCALFLVAGAAGGVMDTFLFVMLRNMGGGGALMGLALTCTCISEVGVFARAGDIQTALGGYRQCFSLVLACFWIRLLLYAGLPLLRSPWAVMPVQLLHGVTFGLFWQISNGYMRALAPSQDLVSTYQGLFQALNSLGSFFGQLLGGIVTQRLGCPRMFLCASIVMSVAHAAYWAATRDTAMFANAAAVT